MLLAARLKDQNQDQDQDHDQNHKPGPFLSFADTAQPQLQPPSTTYVGVAPLPARTSKPDNKILLGKIAFTCIKHVFTFPNTKEENKERRKEKAKKEKKPSGFQASGFSSLHSELSFDLVPET